MNARKVIVAVAALGLTFVQAPAQAEPYVFGLRYNAANYNSTSVSWFKGVEAVSYKIFVNGALAATVPNPELVTTIKLPTLLGPTDVVTAVATDKAGLTGPTMTATYRYLLDPFAPYIVHKSVPVMFDMGSSEVTADGQAKISEFVAALKAHGFTKAKVIGYNAVRVGTVNQLTMAQARADQVRSLLSQQIGLPIVDAVHGVKVARGAAVPDTAARVDLLFW